MKTLKDFIIEGKKSIELEEKTVVDNDGNSLKVGDVVMFKSDVEQYGRITKIDGSTLTLVPDGMRGGKFIGEYIGGDKKTREEAPDVFKESLDEAKNDTSKYTDDKLKAVLKQLKGLDQDAPSTKSMLKKVKKEIEKRGLSEQLEDTTDTLDETKKLKASDIVKILKNPEDWGPDGKDRVYTKGKNFVYIDSFYFTGDKALADLVKGWSSGGSYHKYFLDEYGCNLKIVDKFIELKAEGKHKKFTKDGVVGVELEIN